MDRKQLLYYLAIADECNITKAAQRLRIPQPYLSTQLKSMESELGVQLAQRNTRNLQLTDAGRWLQHRAAQILELMDMTGRELEAFGTGVRGMLKIGTIATSAATLLTGSVRLFHQKFPDVRFEIQNMSTQRILESLKIGTIELGVIRTPLNSEQYGSLYLRDQPMVAACRGGLDSLEEKIELKEIADEPLLVNYRYERAITEACRSAGFEPDIICKADDTRSILYWADAGMGTAVLPKDWLNLVPGLRLSSREIDAPALVTSSAVVWLKSRALSSAAENFLASFQKYENDSHPSENMEARRAD